ncbi:hypothetical protein AAMO2058_001344400 [Amorphochlora amoebiformis]
MLRAVQRSNIALRVLYRGYCSPSQSIGGERGRRNIPPLKVVLDIDECLVHTRFEDEDEQNLLRQQEYRPDIGESPGGRGVEQMSLTMADGARAIVNKRPGLQEFLNSVFDEFETYTYTAAAEVYARPLLDQLDTEGKLKGRFYRQHCQLTRGLYLKDISLVGGDDLRRTILVDNNPISFILQPDNGIPVISFYDQADDETLPSVLEFLRMLDEFEDVRPILRERFTLMEHLQKVRTQVLS